MGGFLLAIKAWSIWARLRAGGLALLQWATANPWPALAVLLLIGNVVQLAMRRHDEAQIAAMKSAEKDAGAAQAQANLQPVIKSEQIARQSDETTPGYLDDVRRAAADHTVGLRNPCPISVAPVPEPDRGPSGDDRPAAPADVVSRPKADDDQLVAAAARAAKMRAVVQDWIAQGIAVPEPDKAADPAP